MKRRGPTLFTSHPLREFLRFPSLLGWLIHLSTWPCRPITCKSLSQAHRHERLTPNHDLTHSSVQKYYMLASAALLFYDLVTTLDIEIARVWRGKLSSFTVLWSLVSYLCVGLNTTSLTELTRTAPLVACAGLHLHCLAGPQHKH